jgi:hypothetical protein
LWLKILLHAAGELPDGYRHGRGGLDEMTLVNLGIDAEAFIGFVEIQMPTYLECEAWLRAHAARLDPASIAAHNEAIASRDKPEEMAVEDRRYARISDASIRKSVALNDLTDWTLAHEVIATAAAAKKSA